MRPVTHPNADVSEYALLLQQPPLYWPRGQLSARRSPPLREVHEVPREPVERSLTTGSTGTASWSRPWTSRHTGATELWTDAEFASCFFLHVGNGRGDYVIGGVSDGPTATNVVLVLNGQRVIGREGDHVDLNGNGLPDDDLFSNTFDDDDGDLTRTGFFYFTATSARARAWRPPKASSSSTSGNTCPWSWSAVGVMTILPSGWPTGSG